MTFHPIAHYSLQDREEFLARCKLIEREWQIGDWFMKDESPMVFGFYLSEEESEHNVVYIMGGEPFPRRMVRLSSRHSSVGRLAGNPKRTPFDGDDDWFPASTAHTATDTNLLQPIR